MRWLLNWRRKLDDQEVTELETMLDATLLPITPRPGFVQELRYGLLNYSPVSISREPKFHERILLVLAGIFSIAFFISMSIQSIVAIIGAISMLHYFRRQTQKKRITTTIQSVG
jgi:hypothetical protein